MERQQHPQVGVLDEAADQRVHRQVRPQLEHLGHDLEHVGQAMKRHVPKLLEADLEDALGLLDEAEVAIDIGRTPGADLLQHLLGVAAVLEVATVVEADPVKRAHRQQLKVVGHLATAQGEQLLDEVRGGHHGRTSVEHIAGIAVDIGPTARLIALLQQGHLVAPRLEPNRRRQPAKPRANHHHPIAALHRRLRTRLHRR